MNFINILKELTLDEAMMRKEMDTELGKSFFTCNKDLSNLIEYVKAFGSYHDTILNQLSTDKKYKSKDFFQAELKKHAKNYFRLYSALVAEHNYLVIFDKYNPHKYITRSYHDSAYKNFEHLFNIESQKKVYKNTFSRLAGKS